MTQKEVADLIDEKVRTAFEIARKTLPYKTGNLSMNAYQIVKIDDTHFDIKIDLNIAPYAEYIDRPGYRSYGYWDRTAQLIIDMIAQELGGMVEKE